MGEEVERCGQWDVDLREVLTSHLFFHYGTSCSMMYQIDMFCMFPLV